MMKNRKKRFNQLFELLSSSEVKTIIILPHVFPDGDTLGSAIGMYHLIKHFKKQGYIVLNDDIPSNLCFILDESIPILKAVDVDQMDIDVCIAVDCGELKLFEDRTAYFNKAKWTVNIDHHKTNSMFAGINIVDSEKSSTGELIYDILDDFGVIIDSNCGKAIYTAIITDTGAFRYTNTTPSTFICAANLMKTGFDFNQVSVELYQNKSFEKMVLLNKVFDTIRLFFESKVAIVKLDYAMMAQMNFSEYDTDGIVEHVRDIKGVEVVVFIRQIGNQSFKISMRSKYNFDVSKVAQRFGGGGHSKAAGFKSSDNCSKIELELIETIKEAMN